jgi:hypothetical protein
MLTGHTADTSRKEQHHHASLIVALLRLIAQWRALSAR